MNQTMPTSFMDEDNYSGYEDLASLESDEPGELFVGVARKTKP